MSITNLIQSTLNLKEKYLSFDESCLERQKIKGVEALVYRATLAPPPPKSCPSCDCMNENFSIIRHGFKTSTLVLPRVSGFKTLLKLKKQRFFCKHCHSTFIASSSIVEPNCFISKNTFHSVVCELKEKSSIVDIAKRHAISHATVNNWLHQLNKHFIVSKNYLPPHLSMDEFKSVKSSSAAMSFVCIDCVSGKTLDIVEDRRLNNLIRYFLSYSRKARESVQSVCIDMYTPYVSLVKACFPNAILITDRFHIIQLLSRSLNKTRIRLMNKDKKNYNKLKRYWKLFLRNYDDLDDNEFKKFTCFSHLQREVDLVNYCVDLDPEFNQSYWFYQDLLSAYQKKDSDAFFTSIDSPPPCLSSYMKTSISSILSFKQSILNSFSSPFSNGKIEGTNNLIKVIKRIAFGYRNFSTFRARILLVTNTMVRFSIRKGTYLSTST